MEIPSSLHPAHAILAPLPTSPSLLSPVESTASDAKNPPPPRIDFSRISPRQLKACLDDMMMNGTPEDFQTASDIAVMLPYGWSEDGIAPMNVTADIEGARDWNRKYGESKLADRLENLLELMKVMELRSIRISEAT